MGLQYLLDEHLRGPLWKAIQRQNARGEPRIDARRVGDASDLPLGMSDPELLMWGEDHDRILVSADRRTMMSHFAAHLRAGRHSPGAFILLPTVRLSTVVEFLSLAAYTSEKEEWRDRIEYLR